MSIFERLRSTRKDLEKRNFEREFESAREQERREEGHPSRGPIREKLRSATAPARIEAKGTKHELGKIREEAGLEKARRVARARASRAGRAASKAAGAGRAVAEGVSIEGPQRARDPTERAMFEGAEQAATMGAPVADAMLEPVSGPEEMAWMAGGGPSEGSMEDLVLGGVMDGGSGDDGPRVDELVTGGGGQGDDWVMGAGDDRPIDTGPGDDTVIVFDDPVDVGSVGLDFGDVFGEGGGK